MSHAVEFAQLTLEEFLMFQQQAEAVVEFRRPTEPMPNPPPGESDTERFSFACIIAKKWGQEQTYEDAGLLMRESIPCTMFLYKGFFSDRQFVKLIPKLAAGEPAVLDGASESCYAWAGMTHELMVLPLPLGIGYGCWHCKDSLSELASSPIIC